MPPVKNPADAEDLVAVKNTGDEEYVGNDLAGPTDGRVRFIRIAAGATAKVTPAKAAQLLEDFPKQFKTA